MVETLTQMLNNTSLVVQDSHPSRAGANEPRPQTSMIIFSEVLWHWNAHEERKSQYKFGSETVQVTELGYV